MPSPVMNTSANGVYTRNFKFPKDEPLLRMKISREVKIAKYFKML